MPKLKKSLPRYLKASGRDTAYFWYAGKRVYLPGKFNSPESVAAYNRAMSELAAIKADESLSVSFTGKTCYTVAAFLRWGETYYTKNGQSTGANEQYYYATIQLIGLYGDLDTDKFRQKEFRRVIEMMEKSGNMSRKTINSRIWNIKRIFDWGVSHEMVSRWKPHNFKSISNKFPKVKPSHGKP
ncbi:MAG: hypothetical protein LBQ54_03755 [Planctomycetaceae bacterium]|jgi:hypothetical protein|nr:hypothetical protein [Planctomycetaceae bacterium]